MNWGYLFTSFEGRINRKPYWLGLLSLIVIGIVLFVGVSLAGIGMMDRSFRIFALVVQLVMLYPSTALIVKRLHDRDRPGWFAAFIIVPSLIQAITNAAGMTGDPTNPNALDYLFNLITFIVGLWFLIELGFMRGTAGPNRYGADPLGGAPTIAAGPGVGGRPL